MRILMIDVKAGKSRQFSTPQEWKASLMPLDRRRLFDLFDGDMDLAQFRADGLDDGSEHIRMAIVPENGGDPYYDDR
ncbi:hypothetical protein [Neoaquamicrobium sediminum]|uniref:hypothetical protein n=1 Tax=Neoaquamicrobium sediminum TaxID=1849104 RepID=UPI003BA9EFB0